MSTEELRMPANISELLRDARLNEGINQLYVTRRVNVPNLAAIERGEDQPTATQLIATRMDTNT